MVLIVHAFGAFPEGDVDDSRDVELSDTPAEVPLITHAILIVHTFGAFPEGGCGAFRYACRGASHNTWY